MHANLIDCFRRSLARFFLGACFAFFLLLYGNASFAGAWVPPQRNGQFIITSLTNLEKLDGIDNYIELYAEYGIKPRISAVFEQSFMHQNDKISIGESLSALKIRAFKLENWVGALQIGILQSARNHENLPTSSLRNAIEIRTLLGHANQKGTWFNLEYATRTCISKLSTQWESTLGQNLKSGDKIIFKAFGQNDSCGAAQGRTQLSYVKMLRNNTNIELGIRVPIDYSAIERFEGHQSAGIIVGVWKSF